jgi:hypothetical protein
LRATLRRLGPAALGARARAIMPSQVIGVDLERLHAPLTAVDALVSLKPPARVVSSRSLGAAATTVNFAARTNERRCARGSSRSRPTV